MTKLPMKELIPKDPTVHGTQHQIGQEVVVRSISTEPIEFIATHAPLCMSFLHWNQLIPGDCEHSRPNEVRIRLTSDSLVYTHTLSLTTRSTCRAVKVSPPAFLAHWRQIFLERYCGYDYDKIK